MSLFAILLFLKGGGDSHLSSKQAKIDSALNTALKIDNTAYYEICNSKSKLRRFRALQARAEYLNKLYIEEFFGPDFIQNKYVDRRSVGRCSKPNKFSKTVARWSTELDRIEKVLED